MCLWRIFHGRQAGAISLVAKMRWRIRVVDVYGSIAPSHTVQFAQRSSGKFVGNEDQRNVPSQVTWFNK